jgi:tRNA threonylcarbamoyladenosine biosynthesis protein TsaB
MDELYFARCEFSDGLWRQHGAFSLVRPEDLVVEQGWGLAGNVFAAYGDRLPRVEVRLEALPGASAMLRLAPALLEAGLAIEPELALPLYIRDKVAQTTEQRALIRATLSNA